MASTMIDDINQVQRYLLVLLITAVIVGALQMAGAALVITSLEGWLLTTQVRRAIPPFFRNSSRLNNVRLSRITTTTT